MKAHAKCQAARLTVCEGPSLPVVHSPSPCLCLPDPSGVNKEQKEVRAQAFLGLQVAIP